MLQKDSLKDKIVVITGGGTGLGRSMAKAFLNLGAKVAITSRKLEVLEKTAKELEKETGGTVHPVSCDVRKWLEVEQMLESVKQNLGTPTTLVNNAAGNFISPTERLSYKAFDVVVDIVLRGSYNCTLAFGKDWIANDIQNTSILNIVTTYAWTGSAYVVPSACAKAGVLAMTRSLAVEWGPKQIRSNAIAPGLFPTKGAWERLLPGDLSEKFKIENKVPLKRTGEHSELCNLATYMISDFAGFMNGEVVTLDGGEWLKGAGQFNMMEMIPTEMWDMIEQMTKQAKSS